MTEPENHTLRLLQDIRREGQELRKSVDRLEGRLEKGFSDLSERLDSLRQAAFGESVLGRYAAAEVEKRVSDLETRS